MGCVFEYLMMNQVGVKLRFLTKRGKTRRDRVEALKAAKEDHEAQLKSTKVKRFLICYHTRSIYCLLRPLTKLPLSRTIPYVKYQLA